MKIFTCILMMMSAVPVAMAQHNFADWQQQQSENYQQWRTKQDWKHNYFEWKKRADSDYQTWLQASGFATTPTATEEDNAATDEVEQQLGILTSLMENLQAQQAEAEDEQADTKIEDLQNQIAALQAENQQLQAQNATTPNIKTWAVVVGVANYIAPQAKLNFCDDDAYKIYAFLRSPEGGAIPEKRMKLLIDEDANGANIKQAIKEYTQKAQKDDVFLFYYSGHGAPDALLGRDFSETRNGYISHKFLKQQMQNCKAKAKICMIDACHSGNVGTVEIAQPQPTYTCPNRRGGAITKGFTSVKDMQASQMFYQSWQQTTGGIAFMLSSKGEEFSIESSGNRQGIFSYHLIEALRSKADYNQDRIVSITEAFDYVQKNVRKDSDNKQNPVIFGDYSHAIPMAFIRK